MNFLFLLLLILLLILYMHVYAQLHFYNNNYYFSFCLLFPSLSLFLDLDLIIGHTTFLLHMLVKMPIRGKMPGPYYTIPMPHSFWTPRECTAP